MLNSGCRTILIKSVRTFVATVWGAMQPLANMKTYQSVRVLPGRIVHRGAERKKKERKQKRYEGKKLESYSSAANRSHCNLISMSKHIDTGSAISNRLFDMPKPRESCMWVLKNR